MAGLLGEGGQGLVGGSCNSATPCVLADFRCTGGNVTTGVDGRPANVYEVCNRDTSNTYILWVKVPGLHDNAASVSCPIYPLENKPFQLTLLNNELQLVQGWITTLANGTTSGNTMVSGGVLSRRV